MLDFPRHTTETASEPARRRLGAIEGAFGYLPAAVSLMANSPEAVEAFSAANAQFERTSLDPVSREVVVMTIATRYDCHVCIAMHSARLEALHASEALVAALRDRTPLRDERYEALRTFTLAAMDGHGVVDDSVVERFRLAGYDERNALEVVLAIGTYTLSAFANRMTAAPLDDQVSA